MIRVAIIAPAMAVRAGLRALVRDDPQMQVVAEATSLAELNPGELQVDVLVWSPSPAQEQELLGVDWSKTGEVAAWLFICNDPKMVTKLLNLPIHAWGMLDTELTQAELVASIHALNEGLMVLNPEWLRLGLANHNPLVDENRDLIEPLTEREVEILQLLAYGLTNKQIAARLKISAHTVKFHVSTIYTKMGTTNRVETVNLGVKKGLIVL